MRELDTCGTCYGRAPAVPPAAPLKHMEATLAALYGGVGSSSSSSTVASSQRDAATPGVSRSPAVQSGSSTTPVSVAPVAASLVCLPLPAWLWILRNRTGAGDGSERDSGLARSQSITVVEPTLNPNPSLQSVAGQALLVADAVAVRISDPALQISEKKQRSGWLGGEAVGGDSPAATEGARASDLELQWAEATSTWTSVR